MERIERTVQVDCPIRTVYNQWTQFEEFPRFMSGVEEVTQLDDTHVRWRTALQDTTNERDIEITEQIPDARITWRSMSGEHDGGTVQFEPLPGNRTLLRVALHAGKATSSEALEAAIEGTMQDFKRYIEKRQVADGAWRGEIHDGQCDPTVSDRRPTDTRIGK